MATITDSSGDPPHYPKAGTFGDLLRWHLEWGTRPGCSTYEKEKNTPWTISAFAELVCGTAIERKSAQRNIANWQSGRLPDPKKDADRIANIFLELFGSTELLVRWKTDLENALERARKEQNARIARQKIQASSTMSTHHSDFLEFHEERKPNPEWIDRAKKIIEDVEYSLSVGEIPKILSPHKLTFIHRIRAKDVDGRWAHFFVLVNSEDEQDFIESMCGIGAIDLDEYGKVVASYYEDEPSDDILAYLRDKYGYSDSVKCLPNSAI